MKAVILHLSDIHIKNDEDPVLKNAPLIAKALYQHIDDESHLIVLISGDIAYSGQKNEYELATSFLKEIEGNIKKEKFIDVDFVMCPGNHDCDFSRNATRSFILEKMQSSDLSEIDYEVFEACTTHQEEYFLFKSIFETNLCEDDKLWATKKIEVGGKAIVFESVNLSWASNKDEQQGQLLFPFSCYVNKKELNADMRISLMHHPLNWLNQDSYRDFRSNLRGISDVVFTGHEHVNNVINHDDVESGETVVIEGGVLQGKASICNSSFNVVSLDLLKQDSYCHIYKYNKTDERYVLEASKKLLDVNSRVQKYFKFTDHYIDKLEDSGGNFKHSNASNLKLSDVFVYPNIKNETSQKSKVNSVSSKLLLSIDQYSKGVVLSGEENIGRTSLVYSLIMEYASKGYFPVLLRGKDIGKKHVSNLDLQIKRALNDQYAEANFSEVFAQESINKKILFIDDFDESRVRSENSRNEMLTYLMSKFEKVILTVDSMFEVSELTSLEGRSTSSAFDHYKIELFGYKKRTELINNWYSVGQQDHESEAEIIGKCNIAEQLMDTVMDKSLISPHPIYLLTFLQSIETGTSTQLSDSALGHYYKFLLTSSFLDVGVSPESIGQELDYVMHLARFFNKKCSFSVTSGELKEFNEYFSNTWQETSFEKKESILLRAKVLKKVGGDYQFRYLYNYYYLLGMYLSKNILEDSVQDEISHYIEHLYVKENANTILFLAHHSSSDNILVMMKHAADELFSNNLAADFNGRSGVIQELIQHAPSLEYKSDSSPYENRIKLSERRDAIDRGRPSHHLKEKEQDPSKLDLATKLTMLFKTIDILSQIIKSNPTKFERAKKVEIIKSVCLAPLRALQDFYNFLESNPNTLVDAINEGIAQKSSDTSNEERSSIARLTVSRIIQGISGAFIIKTAQVINSAVLMPDIPVAVNADSTLALELIDLAISLDNHKPIQRSKVKSIYLKCEANIVAQKVLDLIIMNKLHMFKPTESDMQWLQSELNYDLATQRRIGYSSSYKRTKVSAK